VKLSAIWLFVLGASAINGILKRRKNGECAACLKYSVSIFVE
jgi:hypothetical protein